MVESLISGQKACSWNESFMNIAYEFARHSTCKKLQVGAILVKDRRVISTGYNGVPSGMEHCCDRFKDIDITTPEGRELHHKFCVQNELHAEQNCIAYAARSGAQIDDTCTLYVTHACCCDCAKLVVAAGIKHVVYKEAYKTLDGIEFLKKAGVKVECEN